MEEWHGVSVLDLRKENTDPLESERVRLCPRWHLHRYIWFMSQLSKEEQGCVLRAKNEAQCALEKSLLAREDKPEMLSFWGLPSAQKSYELAQSLHRTAA